MSGGIIMKFLISAIWIYLISIPVSYIIIKKDLNSKKEGFSWLFDLNNLSIYLSFSPIFNTWYISISIYHWILDIIMFLKLQKLKYKLNKFAWKNGFKNFDDMYNRTKEEKQL